MTTERTIANAARVCVDTNLPIYLVEGTGSIHDAARSVFRGLLGRGVGVVMSEIGLAEIRYGLRKRASKVEASYDRLFSGPDAVTIHPVTSEGLLRAADLGAELGLKLLDAVHFEAAVSAGADIFLTNDRRFRSAYGVEVLQLNDL